MHLLPDISNMQSRLYVAERAVRHTYQALVRSGDLVLLPTEKLAKISSEAIALRVRCVPVYCILEILCLEWRRLPIDQKLSMVKSTESFDNLRELNKIYLNDCSMLKTMNDEIRGVENNKVIAQAKAMGLGKRRVRLERKWKDNIASEQELEDLKALREEHVSAMTVVSAVESQLEGFEAKRRRLKMKIEDLWIAVTAQQQGDAAKRAKAFDTREDSALP